MKALNNKPLTEWTYEELESAGYTLINIHQQTESKTEIGSVNKWISKIHKEAMTRAEWPGNRWKQSLTC